MKRSSVLLTFVVCMFVFQAQQVQARTTYTRMNKRIAELHLADLQTRIALRNDFKGIVITVPIGGGKLELAKIGRRKRSEASELLDELSRSDEEEDGVPKELESDEDVLDREYSNSQ